MSVRKVFVIAMDNEAAAVTAHFEGVSEETVFSRRVIRGTLDGEPTAIVVAGIGKSNAAAAAQLALCLFNPEVLLNVGVAGALHAPMKVAEIYRVRAAVQYDFDLAQINGTKIGTLNEYQDREIPLDLAGNALPEALLATGDRFNDSQVDYRFLVGGGRGRACRPPRGREVPFDQVRLRRGWLGLHNRPVSGEPEDRPVLAFRGNPRLLRD